MSEFKDRELAKELREVLTPLGEEKWGHVAHQLTHSEKRGRSYVLEVARFCATEGREAASGLAELASGFRKANASQVVTCLREVLAKVLLISQHENFGVLAKEQFDDDEKAKSLTVGWLTFLFSYYVRDNLWDLAEIDLSADTETSLCVSLIRALSSNPIHFRGLKMYATTLPLE